LYENGDEVADWWINHNLSLLVGPWEKLRKDEMARKVIALIYENGIRTLFAQSPPIMAI